MAPGWSLSDTDLKESMTMRKTSEKAGEIERQHRKPVIAGRVSQIFVILPGFFLAHPFVVFKGGNLLPSPSIF